MTAFVPPRQSGVPVSVSKGILPILPGGEGAYSQRQFDTLRTQLENIAMLIPQSATAAPKQLLDSMIRLSRAPWRPVAGTTVDAWVYWDAAGQVWRLLSTAPTNT